MDADPGQQWLLVLVGAVLAVIGFYFATYEQALSRITKQELENASRALSQSKQSRVLKLAGKLPTEYYTAHVARLAACVTAFIFWAAALMLFVHENLLALSCGSLVLGLVTAVLFDPFFEKLPAKMRARQSVKTVLKTYRYQHWILLPFYPLAKLSCWLSKVLEKSKVVTDDKSAPLSWQNIVELIEEGRSKGELDNDEFEMIDGILSLHEKMAREVMVPRIDAFMIDITNDNDRSIDDILQMNYSRVPVYHEDKDKVVGIVHIKNLVKAARTFGFEHTTIRQVMQEPFFVPETIMLDRLIYEMKKTQNQMAILLDEYGGVVGLVTLEDLLEEIVGEIQDESDEPDLIMKKMTSSEFIVQGKMALDDFNEEFGQNLNVPDIDTIAGYIIWHLGYIPKAPSPEPIELEDGSSLLVHKMSGDRLLQVQVNLAQEAVEYRKQREESKKSAREKLELNR